MHAYTKMLNATKYAGGILLVIGLIIFSYGYFLNGLISTIGIGMGIVIGAVFIFLMGVFFVATDEMLQKTLKGTEIYPGKE